MAIQLVNETLEVNMTLVELRQRHVEQFAELVKSATDLPLAKYRGAVVRAIITAGWVASPPMKPKDVDEMAPDAVIWISEEIATIYARVMGIDPKP